MNFREFLVAVIETLIFMVILVLTLGLSFAPYLEAF